MEARFPPPRGEATPWPVLPSPSPQEAAPMSPKLRDLLTWFSGNLGERTESGHVLLWLLRGCFGAIIISMAMLALDYLDNHKEFGFVTAVVVFLGILAIGLTIVMTDILVRNKQITTISAVYFGLLLGLLL